MGRPVVHFEIMGKDGPALQSFYSDLFDWKIDSQNPMGYGMVARDDNLGADGVGIGGGIGQLPEGYPAYATIYVGVDDVEAALAKAESMGATRVMGPEVIMDMVEVGMFADPEGNNVGVVRELPQ
jgi:predicted enzyme related to lactoylglutathione lyase